MTVEGMLSNFTNQARGTFESDSALLMWLLTRSIRNSQVLGIAGASFAPVHLLAAHFPSVWMRLSGSHNNMQGLRSSHRLGSESRPRRIEGDGGAYARDALANVTLMPGVAKASTAAGNTIVLLAQQAIQSNVNTLTRSDVGAVVRHSPFYTVKKSSTHYFGTVEESVSGRRFEPAVAVIEHEASSGNGRMRAANHRTVPRTFALWLSGLSKVRAGQDRIGLAGKRAETIKAPTSALTPEYRGGGPVLGNYKSLMKLQSAAPFAAEFGLLPRIERGEGPMPSSRRMSISDATTLSYQSPSHISDTTFSEIGDDIILGSLRRHGDELVQIIDRENAKRERAVFSTGS